jgi:hypothetical protein
MNWCPESRGGAAGQVTLRTGAPGQPGNGSDRRDWRLGVQRCTQLCDEPGHVRIGAGPDVSRAPDACSCRIGGVTRRGFLALRAVFRYVVLFGHARGWSRNVDGEVSELALCSPNFGFLAPLEPLLVIDGVAAESHVYTDPDAAMIMARRFTETLARELVARTRTRVSGRTQHDRIRCLARVGVLVPNIRDAFDHVRRTGNRAAHSRFGDVRAAVEAVRICFELGVWFHRAVTNDVTARPFIPPPDPEPDQTELSARDRVQLLALRDDLNRHRRRLADVLAYQDQSGDQARSGAGEALARANADREQLSRIAAHLGNRLAEVERAFNDRVATPPPVNEADRRAFIDSARDAARWLTDVACDAVAEALDRRIRLEVATWTGPGGQTLTVTYTPNFEFRFTGTLLPDWSIEDRPWPDHETLRMTLADLERKGYQPADDEGTRAIRARLLIPGALEFLSAADVTAPPACPPWCIADHSGYVDWFHECQGPGIELRCLDGHPVSAEPIQLTDACSGEAGEAVVRVGDNHLDAAAARTYAAGILAAAAVIDPQPLSLGRVQDH